MGVLIAAIARDGRAEQLTRWRTRPTRGRDGNPVVLTGHSPSPRSSYEAITLVAAITLPLIFSPIIFLFASLSVNLLNIFNNLSKARQASTTT